MKGAGLYLLDTNTVSYIVNGRSQGARKMLEQRAAAARIAISTVTEAEMLYGLALKPAATRLRQLVEEVMDNLEVLPWDSAAAAAYGELRADLAKRGRSLSALDTLIAAHAISRGAVLVSADGAFAVAAPTLQVENWAGDL